MEAKIPRAKSKVTGKVITISQVLERGRKCNCICYQCGKDLQAVMGMKNVWHFRHDIKATCSGGIESSLHELAKEVFIKNSFIIMPGGEYFYYSQALIEKYYNDLVPDVELINDDGEVIWIEIVVTNRVCPEKLKKIQAHNITCVVIDLSSTDRNIEYEELEHEVIKVTTFKSYIHKRIIKTEDKEGAVSFHPLIVCAGLFLLWMFNKPKRIQKQRSINSFKNRNSTTGKGKTDYPSKMGSKRKRLN